MAFLDILKKKKKEPSPKETPKEPKKKEVKKEVKEVKPSKEEKVRKVSEAERPRARKSKKFPFSYRVLNIPHITEKATDLTKENKYTFKVFPRANKAEVKRAVESVYDVDVISVRIINIPPKKRRLGKNLGQRKGYKKAIVKIKEGQKIEVLPR